MNSLLLIFAGFFGGWILGSCWGYFKGFTSCEKQYDLTNGKIQQNQKND